MSIHRPCPDYDQRPILPPIRDLFREELSQPVRAPTHSPSFAMAHLQVSDDEDPQHERQPSHQRPQHSDYRTHAPPMTLDGPSGSRTSSRMSGRFKSCSHSDMPSQPNPSSTSYHPERGTSHDSYVKYPLRNHVPSQSARMVAEPVQMQIRPPPNTSSRHSYTYDDGDESDDATPIAAQSSGRMRQQEKPEVAASKYECSYCGKGFNRPSSLKIHLNSHTGERPFVCPVAGCGRAFSVLSNMRRHARVHYQTPLQLEAEDDMPSPPLSGSSGSPLTPSSKHSPATPHDFHTPRSHVRRASDTSSNGSSRRTRSPSLEHESQRPEKRRC